MLLRTRQTPHQHQQHSLTAAGASVGPPRAVVTFYYNANRDRDRSGSSNRNGSSSSNRRGGNQKLRAEIDLQDFEVLVETYKFLLTNHRKTLSPQASSSKSRGKALSSSSSHHKKNNSNNSSNNNNKKHNKKKNDHHLVVTELHKQAIVTLVTVDEVTKRVTEILPEFFPPTTKILPVCLSRLDCLRCLRLDHCSELASFPAGFCLRGLEELGLNVSSFAEPLPASFGETNQLKRLVLYGTCAGLVRPVPSSDSDSDSSNSNSNSNSNSDDGSSTKNTKNKSNSNSNNYNNNYNPNNMETETVLFPPSMHRIHLEYLETHVQNLLHISPMVLDGWSSSVETLVVTQDLTSSSPLGGSSHHSSVSRKITIPRKQKVTQKQKQKQKARVKRNNNAKSFLRRRSFDDDSFGCDDNDEFDILGLSDDDDEYEYENENEYNKYNHSSNDSTSSTSSSSSSSNGSNSSEDGGFSILKHGGSVFREALRNQVEERTFRSIAKFQNLKTLRLLFDDSKHRKDYKRKQKKAFATTEDPYCVPLSLLAGPLSLSLRELDISTTHCWGAGVGVGVGVDTQNSRSSTRKAATTSVIPIEVSWIDVLCDFPLLERLALRDCSCSFATGDESAERAKLLEEHDSPLLLPELKQLILDRCPDFALVMANNNNNNNNNTNNTNNNSNNSNTTTTNNNNNSSSSAMEDISFSQHSQHQPQLQRLQQLQSQHQVQVLQHQDCDSDYFLSDHNGSLQEIVFTGAGRTTNTNTNTNSNTDEDEFHSDDCGCCHSHSSNSDDDYGEGQICCYYNDDEDDGDNDCLYHRNHHHHHNHNQYYYEGEDCILDPIAMDDIQMMMMDTVMDDYDYEEYDDPLDDHDAISRIVKLTSLVADTTALSPIEREDKLAILCFKFLSRCPKLAVLHLRECQIHGFCRDLLTCLPTDTFSELVLDAVYEDDRLVCRDHNHSNSSSSDNDCCGCVVRNNLWALVDAYPSLVHLQGTYTNGLDDKTEHEKLTKQLVQRRQQQQSLHNHVFAGAAAAVFRGRRPWRMLFANNNNSNSNSNSNNNPEEPEYDPVKASGLEQDTRQARIISMELGERQKQNQKHHGPQPLPAAPPRAAFRGLPAVRVLGQRLNSIRKNAGLVR